MFCLFDCFEQNLATYLPVSLDFVLVTGLVCSAVLKKLSKRARNAKELVLSKDLEDHSKYSEIDHTLYDKEKHNVLFVSIFPKIS